MLLSVRFYACRQAFEASRRVKVGVCSQPGWVECMRGAALTMTVLTIVSSQVVRLNGGA